MTIEADLARIDAQERVLRLRAFDLAAAWELGMRLRSSALQRGVAIAIEVRLQRETVFFCAMPGTTPENADWARRKRNTVELLHRSSYAVGLALERDGSTLEKKMALPLRDYAVHGGSVPIRVEGIGCVGSVTVSGLPQRDDHELVASTLADLCGVSEELPRLD
jgi:uncharacterized protein (UPF0303 family)